MSVGLSSRNLHAVREVRYRRRGVGCRVPENILGIVWVDNYDMAFLEMVYKGVHIGEVHTATLVIAALGT